MTALEYFTECGVSAEFVESVFKCYVPGKRAVAGFHDKWAFRKVPF
jgi:hypothetical protein